jgi:transcription factor SPN1
MQGNTTSTRNQDPLSETLAGMKNPKVPELAEMDKENYVDKLQKKMDRAVRDDNECLANGQPALNKLKLMPALVQTFNMKSLQNTLLERDILCNLRDFLEPKDKNTLPALAVRKTIYDILLKLAVTPEYLKRVNDEKPPIGAVIVQLR